MAWGMASISLPIALDRSFQIEMPMPTPIPWSTEPNALNALDILPVFVAVSSAVPPNWVTRPCTAFIVWVASSTARTTIWSCSSLLDTISPALS